MRNRCFDIEKLKDDIANGDLHYAIQSLTDSMSSCSHPFSTDILLLSGRFNALEKENMRRMISDADYRLEFNAVSRSLMDLLQQIDNWEKSSAATETLSDPNVELEQLNAAFEAGKAVNSTASRLRTKNQLAREMSQVFIQHPGMVEQYLSEPTDGIINGICRKVIQVPALGDAEVLARLADKTESAFTKGNIVNALAEIVYTNSLRFGEDQLITNTLNQLTAGADFPLQKNIERVEAALNYLIKDGAIPVVEQNKQEGHLIDGKGYQLDERIKGVAESINAAWQKGGKTAVDSSFLISQIDKLFNRMTFRGEPRIEMCGSQRWSTRVHSALMTHHFLLKLEPAFVRVSTTRQSDLYQDLLLAISKYIDRMIAYLFSKLVVREEDIRHLLGKAEFAQEFRKNEEIRFDKDSSIDGVLMDENIKNTINKYLQGSINTMDKLKNTIQ